MLSAAGCVQYVLGPLVLSCVKRAQSGRPRRLRLLLAFECRTRIRRASTIGAHSPGCACSNRRARVVCAHPLMSCDFVGGYNLLVPRRALGVEGPSLRLGAHRVGCSRALFVRLRESRPARSRTACIVFRRAGTIRTPPPFASSYWGLNAVRGQGEHPLLEHIARAVRAAIGALVSCVRALADIAPLRRAGIIYLSRARRYGSKAHLSVCAAHDVNSSRAVLAHAVGCGLRPVCSRTACIVVRRVGTVRTPPPFTSATGVYVRRLMPYEVKARP
ncbi:hypothetical protein DFH08DRAFT_674 [Mycena albidolilacea]|uniref:Uncharacterized protein n=1 Tax=Mycena albidolilacea TaxID=1033008 RepID=A0AAD7F5I9_9AGAR|nr:hypothetical protein DFH08DRAFT_674 [Mycena albidolilacea]